MTTQKEPSYPSIWSNLAQLSFRQDWVDAGGVQTRYVQAGSPSAPTVILLHGMAASWEGFCANLKELSQHFNVIAIDELGCGFTDKPDVEYTLEAYGSHVRAVMEALNIEHAHFVGVSMGALITSRFAVSYPEITDKIVLVSAMAGKRLETTPDVEFAAALENIKQERERAVREPTWENVAPVVDTLIYDPAKRIPDFVAIRQAVYRQPEMLASMGRIMAMAEAPFYNRTALSDEEWTKITSPVLLVTSEHDASFYREAAEKMLSLIPRARRVEFKDVGHWPQFEDPERFNEVAIAFLLNA